MIDRDWRDVLCGALLLLAGLHSVGLWTHALTLSAESPPYLATGSPSWSRDVIFLRLQFVNLPYLAIALAALIRVVPPTKIRYFAALFVVAVGALAGCADLLRAALAHPVSGAVRVSQADVQTYFRLAADFVVSGAMVWWGLGAIRERVALDLA